MENTTTQDTNQNTNQQSATPVAKPNVNVNQEDDRRWFMKKQTVKDKIRALDCQIGGNFFPRLNEFIEDTLVKAVSRTKCNKRKTVRAMDI